MRVALLTDTALVPTRKHPDDAGLDLYADLEDKYVIELFPGDVEVINTGVTVEIPTGCFGWITNKSRNDYIIGGGIVDENYQGELLVKVINVTNKRIEIKHGQAIAQLLILGHIRPLVEVVDPLEIHKVESKRGSDGGIVRQTNVNAKWFASPDITFIPEGTDIFYFDEDSHDGFNYDDDSNLYGDK